MSPAPRSERVLEVFQGALRPARARRPVVMVAPTDDLASERAVETAAEVAHLLHGEVLGVGRGSSAEHQEFIDLLTGDAAVRFEAALRNARTDGRWRTVTDSPLAAVQASAHEADLIVTSRTDGSPSGRRFGRIERLVCTTGRPVLVAGVDGAVRFDHAVVCWNDSPQARRATADALPLLRRTRRTLVLFVCQDGGAAQDTPRAREVARGFRERGVNASAIVRTFGDEDLGEVLRDVARQEDADWVVAGAYGRGPIWRTVTGSHTEALLTALDRPLFLSR